MIFSDNPELVQKKADKNCISSLDESVFFLFSKLKRTTLQRRTAVPQYPGTSTVDLVGSRGVNRHTL